MTSTDREFGRPGDVRTLRPELCAVPTGAYSGTVGGASRGLYSAGIEDSKDVAIVTDTANGIMYGYQNMYYARAGVVVPSPPGGGTIPYNPQSICLYRLDGKQCSFNLSVTLETDTSITGAFPVNFAGTNELRIRTRIIDDKNIKQLPIPTTEAGYRHNRRLPAPDRRAPLPIFNDVKLINPLTGLDIDIDIDAGAANITNAHPQLQARIIDSDHIALLYYAQTAADGGETWRWSPMTHGLLATLFDNGATTPVQLHITGTYLVQ